MEAREKRVQSTRVTSLRSLPLREPGLGKQPARARKRDSSVSTEWHVEAGVARRKIKAHDSGRKGQSDSPAPQLSFNTT